MFDYELKKGKSFSDLDTANYYSTRASVLVEKYKRAAPGFADIAGRYSEKGVKALDIGCGSGRDLAELDEAGFDVTGAEPSEEMMREAAVKYPAISGRLIRSGLPDLKGIGGGFGLVLCSAVIQHIPTCFLYESFTNIGARLSDGGVFILSFPLDYPGIDSKSRRDSEGRLFILRPEEKYRFLIERQGFNTIARNIQKDSLKRSDISWGVHVYRKENG